METLTGIEVLAKIENIALSVWIREALWAFPSLLVLHAVGMAFLVGTSLVINLRLLGLVPALSLSPLTKFFPVITLAFAVNLISGLLLLLAYPAKGLTNPLFFIKMVLVISAVTFTYRQKSLLTSQQVIPVSAKTIAALILLLWAGGIFSGRLLAYTHTWLLVN